MKTDLTSSLVNARLESTQKGDGDSLYLSGSLRGQSKVQGEQASNERNILKLASSKEPERN